MRNEQLKWQAPYYQVNRFGFEVTMYIGLKPNPSATCNKTSVVKKAGLALFASALLMTSGLSLAAQGSWRFAGGGIQNNAHNKTENEISPSNVGQLVTKFVCQTAPNGQIGDVRVAPSVLGNVVYFPDMAGNLTAVDNRSNGTCKVIWKKNFVTDYSPQLHGLDNNIPVGATVKYGWTTPTIMGNLLIIGSGGPITSFGNPTNAIHEEGAVVMAINRHTGALVWARQIDNHPTATIMQSPMGKGNTIYVGVSSTESFLVGTGYASSGGPVTLPITGDVYQCCTFRGSMVALDKSTGQIKWKFHTVPNAPGEPAAALNDWKLRNTGAGLSWSGNSVWGSTPVIDLARGSLYFGTGQTHTLPNSVTTANNLAYPTAPFVQLTPSSYPSSIPAGNYGASIIALNLSDGTRKWSKSFGKLRGFDGWNDACVSWAGILGISGLDFASIPYCPINEVYDASTASNNIAFLDHPFDFAISAALAGGSSPYAPNGDPASFAVPFPSGTISWDHDFGQGPMLVKNVMMPNGSKKDLLIAAQKSGITRALDPSTGNVIWQTFEGTGGQEGGHEFGSATDGKRVYLATNYDLGYIVAPAFGVTLPGVILKDGSSAAGNGYFSALDIATGQILWETIAPFGAGAANPLTGTVGPPQVTAMMSVANGVVYGFVSDDNGTLVALNAATGQVLFQFATGNAAAGQPTSMRQQRAVVVNGVVYFGNGSSQNSDGKPGNKLFALTLPAHQNCLDDLTSTDDNDGNIDGIHTQ